MKFGSWLTLVVICAGFGAIPAKAISPDLWQNDLARAQTFVVGPWELYLPPLFFGRADALNNLITYHRGLNSPKPKIDTTGENNKVVSAQ